MLLRFIALGVIALAAVSAAETGTEFALRVAGMGREAREAAVVTDVNLVVVYLQTTQKSFVLWKRANGELIAEK